MKTYSAVVVILSLIGGALAAQQPGVKTQLRDLPLTKSQRQQVMALQSPDDPAELVRLGAERKPYLVVRQAAGEMGNAVLSIYRLTQDHAELILDENASDWRFVEATHNNMPDLTTVLNLSTSVREEKNFQFDGRLYEPVKCTASNTNGVGVPQQGSFHPCPGDRMPIRPTAVAAQN